MRGTGTGEEKARGEGANRSPDDGQESPPRDIREEIQG